MQEKLDSSGLEKAKLDNLIRDLKEELKVNFLAKQELKLQLDTAAERENTVKSELKKKEKELKTEVEKNKVSKIYLWIKGGRKIVVQPIVIRFYIDRIWKAKFSIIPSLSFLYDALLLAKKFAPLCWSIVYCWVARTWFPRSGCVQVVALSSDWLVWLRLSTVIGWSNLNDIKPKQTPF